MLRSRASRLSASTFVSAVFVSGLLVFASATSASLVGCSSTSVTSGDAGAVAEPVTTRVTAAEGGTITAPSGKGSLAIPAGALPADVDITLALTAASNGSVSDVWEFGPTGTTFSKPATLQIAVGSAVAPEGKKLALAVEEGGAWKTIEGSGVEGANVKGSITHFSKFSIVLVDGKAVASSECSAVVSAFTACGGNVVGTWAFQDFCLSDAQIGSDPFQGKCPAAKIVADVSRTGDYVITATTVTEGPSVTTTSVGGEIPQSCASGATCDALGKGIYKDVAAGASGTCVDGANATCTCSGTLKSETLPQQEPEAYTITGNMIKIGDEEPTEFCVKGNKLEVRVKGETNYVYVLSKK